VTRLHRALGVLAVIAATAPERSRAQEETSVDIEIGSSRRVGGRGITDEDRRRYDRATEPDEPLTEANLPGPGEPRRTEGLHTLAERYIGSDMWKEACAKYDLLREEAGDDAIRERDRGALNAGRAYLGCAKRAYLDGDFDRAEEMLRVSESFIPSSGRHDALRWKMLRDGYREKVGAGDVDGGLEQFRRMQELRTDEDERLWLGEQIAAAAWSAHRKDDDLRRDHLMRLGHEIAPLNVELRRLERQTELTRTVGSNIVLYGVGGFVVVGILTLLSRWRSRARVQSGLARPRRRKNPFLDDEDEVG
jgi:hypothetical protein